MARSRGNSLGWAKTAILCVGCGVIGAVLSSPASTTASSVFVPHTFINGEIADANQVNENFTVIAASVNDNDRRVEALEATVKALQDELLAITGTLSSVDGRLTSGIEALDDRVDEIADRLPSVEESRVLERFSLDETSDGEDGVVRTLVLEGVNLQIVNGEGATATTNGHGNLIVGYNELRPGDGNSRVGSHNIVVGRGNNFRLYGGIAAGRENTISGAYASVTGGAQNEARGEDSSVSGGCGRTVTGLCDWTAGQLFQEE